MPEPGEALSERELEVLRLVATGAANDQVARQLFISTNTVKVHLRNIFAKLGVASRTEASLCAVREGWVVLGPSPATQEPTNRHPTETAVPGPAAASWPRWAIPTMIAVLALALVFSLTDLPKRWFFPDRASPSPLGMATTERWNVRTDMPTPRSDLALVPFRGLLYAIGGESAQGVSNAVERFDPLQNAWKSLARKPTAVAEAQGAVLGERIYIPGGRDAQGHPTAATEVYEIEQDRWRPAASLPRPLSAYAMVPFEGKLYLFGGSDGVQYRDEILRYTPETDRWDEVGRLPFPLGHAGAVVADNRILLIGGINAGGPVNVLLYYSPASGTWETQPLLDVSLGRVRAAALTDFLYVAAEPQGTAAPQLWQYHIQTKAWQAIESSAAGFYPGAAISAMGTDLFLIGGRDREQYLSLNQKYRALFTVVLPGPTP